MITSPNEKAEELIEKFRKHARPISSGFLVMNEDTIIKSAKECAILCVNEILESDPYSPYNGEWYELASDRLDYAKLYWKEVIEEIKNLK